MDIVLEHLSHSCSFLLLFFAFGDVMFVIVLCNIMNKRNQDSFKRVLKRDFAACPRRFSLCWFTWSPLSQFGHQDMFLCGCAVLTC